MVKRAIVVLLLAFIWAGALQAQDLQQSDTVFSFKTDRKWYSHKAYVIYSVSMAKGQPAQPWVRMEFYVDEVKDSVGGRWARAKLQKIWMLDPSRVSHDLPVLQKMIDRKTYLGTGAIEDQTRAMIARLVLADIVFLWKADSVAALP